MSKKIRLYVIIGAAAAVLLATGVVVAVNLFSNKVDNAIPQANLFGPTTPPYGNLSPSPRPSPTPPPGADIVGPLNILIVGVDTREDEPTWQPKADAVMLMHVNKDLSERVPDLAPPRPAGRHPGVRAEPLRWRAVQADPRDGVRLGGARLEPSRARRRASRCWPRPSAGTPGSTTSTPAR